jgi:tetratricopeptide (TPR) repeat protein
MTVSLCLALMTIALRPVHAAPKPSKAPKEAPAATVAVGDSVTLLERAVARDSSRFDDLYRLGVAYLDRDKVKEAVTVLTKAHALRPKDNRATVNLGIALDADSQPALAQQYYRLALALSPSDSIASCRLASSLYSQTKYSQAVDLLSQIIRTSPRAYCAYFTMGVAFADAGIYRDAIRMWRKVVELAPTSPEATSARESIEVLDKFVSQ